MRKASVAVVLAVLMLVMGPSVVAAKGIQKGVKGGLSLANFMGNDSQGSNARTGFSEGLFVRIPITSVISIQAEVLYVTKGAERDTIVSVDDGSGGTRQVSDQLTYKMDYLEVPVLARFDVFNSGAISAGLYGGPYAALKLASKLKEKQDKVAMEWDIDNSRDFDFGLVFGGGADIGIGGSTVVLEGRYALGLTKVYRDPTLNDDIFLGPEGEAPSLDNSVLSFSVGVMF